MVESENPAAAAAFALWTRPMSYAAVARRLGIERRTAARLIREEAARRRADGYDDHDAILAQQVASYIKVRDRAFALLESNDPATAARGAKAAIDALRGLDRIQGLEQPRTEIPLSPLAGLSPSQLMELLRLTVQRKEAARVAEMQRAVQTIDVDDA